jgi:glycosidase
MKLMLDFVPNHMGPDHPWVEEHPEFFINGNETDLEQNPQNYTRVKRKQGDLVFAYGRDPYFSGWPDTVQLDYSNPDAAKAMKQELVRIAGQCDGVRCDMAMLILPDVFERTWGRKAQPFWNETIKTVRAKSPDFCFMAEVYWDMEWDLQQLGFDYAYDKRLYDRLHEGHAKPVREHFYAGLDYQNKLARFLENHDEPRATLAFGQSKHEAAAIITYLSPGLRFFHQGQSEGRKKRISPHLVRAPKEPVIEELQQFYFNLLAVLKNPVFRNGKWQLLQAEQAWDGNSSWDSYLVFSWEGTDEKRILVTVNYAPYQSQCYVRLPYAELSGHTLCLRDMMGETFFDRHGSELISGGLYLDMPAWGYHVFEIGL